VSRFAFSLGFSIATMALAGAACSAAKEPSPAGPALPASDDGGEGARQVPAKPPGSEPSATDGGSTSARVVRYVALGDSFTIGTGSTPAESFPARLGSAWSGPACEVRVQNLGVNGYSSKRLINEELPVLASEGADFVTLAIGANDIVQGASAETYRSNLKTIVQAVGKTPLVAIPQPAWWKSPAAQGFGSPEELRQKIAQFNGILAEEVRAAGGSYVDLGALMIAQAERGELAPDQLHPSAVAYGAWAAELAKGTKNPCAP